MPSTIFHHWLDEFRTLPPRRRRRIRAALAMLAVVVAFALGALVGRGVGFTNGLAARAHRLAARNAALEADNQSLRQQQQTDGTALDALKKTLAARDAELQSLKQEQALYARLISGDDARSGLGVHSFALARVAHTNAFNFTATLVDTAEHKGAAHGTLTVAVEGVAGGKLKTLAWADLAGAGAGNGVPFAFKFFQQLQGSLALPAGFVPNRIAVTLHPEGGPEVTRTLDWANALAEHGAAAATP